MDLALLAALVAALSLTCYVLLDGFDFGVGALLMFAKAEADRDLIVTSVAPVWDGNETWLIMAGVTLLGCLPVAYGVLLPAFYVPLLLMLWSLGFRGVAFEFRFQQHAWRWLWDRAFGYGSIAAAAFQGLVLGGLVQGVAIDGHSFAGGTFDFLTPFSCLAAALVVAAYGLTCAGWLVWRTEGALEAFARRAYRRLLVAVVLLGLGFVGIAAARVPEVSAAWRDHGARSAATLALFLAAAPLAWMSLRSRNDARPFQAALLVVASGLVGLALVIFPYAVPFRITLWDAASPPDSLAFLLVGVIALMPVVLGYTAFAYWMFRGKVEAEAAS